MTNGIFSFLIRYARFFVGPVNVLGDRASSTLPLTPVWPVPKHFRPRIILVQTNHRPRLNAIVFPWQQRHEKSACN
jgi:hypothetical protein